MKILVVDDEQSFGALLGHTLKRLGHRPVVALDPADALAMLDSEVEAVITDIDMPGMSGVELAREIRARRRDMPIAFCTGSAPGGDDVREASLIGRVLPKVWTVADVRAVVEDLRGRQREQSPRPRSPTDLSHMYADDESAREPSSHSVTRGRGGPVPAAPSGKPPKVRVGFRRWSQIKRLCDDSRKGPVYASVPGRGELAPGQEVAIELSLPDEITVKIPGEVYAVRPASDVRGAEIVIELAGLTDEVSRRLRSLAIASEPALAGESAYLAAAESGYRDVVASGTPAPAAAGLARGSERTLRVSELLFGNDQLRHQIERLPSRLQRLESLPGSGDTEDDYNP